MNPFVNNSVCQVDLAGLAVCHHSESCYLFTYLLFPAHPWSTIKTTLSLRLQTVYSYVWFCSRVCTRLHHQSGYTDISYVGPVTSSLCRQPHIRRPSVHQIVHSRSLVHAPGTHFLLTFVMHPVWTLLRSVSNYICFLLLTSYNYFLS